MPKPRLSIAQRRVGLELRRLRTEAGKTLEDVGTVMEWSPSKVSRVETGESPILVRDVQLLSYLLGAEPEVSDALVDLVKAAKVKGWWEPYRDVLGGNYIPFEAEADEVNEFQMEVVCGLLQTSAYARAIMRGARLDADDEEIERRVQMRLDRQEALAEEEPLRLWSIMSEGALRREIGGGDVLRAQLKHLAELTERPNIDVQVLPFDAGAHPAVTCLFTILRFDDAEPLVFGNGLTTNPEIEDPVEKQRMLDAFDFLRAAAESPERSLRIIKEAAMGR
ncbi:helix-turn-helix domain-containing protein [Pseudonocardia acaciae]|uniref:helix-turn-helix domain-containing protein n=1 Tax=Pseudonocardia acaciae TaxID=551276 RepID=UPI0005630AD0|nr:helix-turn-helix transcriptional regulator [Pseudonocardia acaciae]